MKKLHLFARHLRHLGKSYRVKSHCEKSRGALESKRKHNGLAKLVNLTKHWGWMATSWKRSAETDSERRLQESEESDKTSLFLKSLALKGFGLQDVLQLFPMVGSGGRNFSGKVLVLRARRLLHTVLYRKIPKICPGVYIFQRPFLRGLSTEGDLRCKIDLG